MVEAQFNFKISCCRTDQGGEFFSHTFSTYGFKVGLHQQLTTANTPNQNGISEHKNCTLMEGASSLSFGANLPGYLQEEIIRASNYLFNRYSTHALVKSTPYQKLIRRKPDLSHLRVIGSVAYVSLHSKNPSRLEARSVCTVLLGYNDCSKAYCCFAPHSWRILISKDVIIDKNYMGIPAAPLVDGVTLEDAFTSPMPSTSSDPPADLPFDVSDPPMILLLTTAISLWTHSLPLLEHPKYNLCPNPFPDLPWWLCSRSLY
jgi:hypothetical protein